MVVAITATLAAVALAFVWCGRRSVALRDDDMRELALLDCGATDDGWLASARAAFGSRLLDPEVARAMASRGLVSPVDSAYGSAYANAGLPTWLPWRVTCAACALAASAAVSMRGDVWQTLACAILGGIAICDVRHRTVPVPFVLALCVAAAGFLFLSGDCGRPNVVIASATFVVCLVMHLVPVLVNGNDLFGMGDVLVVPIAFMFVGDGIYAVLAVLTVELALTAVIMRCVGRDVPLPLVPLLMVPFVCGVVI